MVPWNETLEQDYRNTGDTIQSYLCDIVVKITQISHIVDEIPPFSYHGQDSFKSGLGFSPKYRVLFWKILFSSEHS